jgi:uncharacterized protein YbjT (DUF2867 family)
MARDASQVSGFDPGVSIIEADVLRAETLAPALRGVEVAYYLIHSMAAAQEDFHERDRAAARNFAVAAKIAGVKRVIYLGGLSSGSAAASEHLKSRQETGELLREFGPPVTEFRAGIVVGNGSISYEIIRYLTERLPVMICPRWVVSRTQPIAIDDALEYLVSALAVAESTGEIVEIGGASVESYRTMMAGYARARGLRRWLIRIPVLTPRLSSYWLRLVTPIPMSIARPLIEGVKTEVVCTSSKASQLFPEIKPVSYESAIQAAMGRSMPPESFLDSIPVGQAHVGYSREGMVSDVRQMEMDASAEQVFSIVENLGGEEGWLYADFLWSLRGWVDTVCGGVGRRRGHSRSGPLRAGDRVDFWAVEDVVPESRLLLRAEMKLPGRAWLEFRLTPLSGNQTRLRCVAWFEPRGFWGEIYWWVLYPVHIWMFRGLVRAIGQRAKGLVRG